jgi:hypothetical protein
MTATPVGADRNELFNLYKIAVDEYRFEVTLNNERLFRFLVFDAAILSVGTGLLKTTSVAPVSNIFVILLFVAGALTSRLGIRAIRKGHEYYRRAIYKKTLIETYLGLNHPLYDAGLGVNTEYPGASIAIATTVGQSEINEILQRPESWIARPLRKGTIVQYGVGVLQLLLVANICAAILSGILIVVGVLRGTPVL